MVCKLEAFKGKNDCLELAGHVAGWTEALLCRVQEVVCLYKFCYESDGDTCELGYR